MDPNATLARIREIVRALNAASPPQDVAPLAFELAELTEALDDWLSAGGFLPTGWDR